MAASPQSTTHPPRRPSGVAFTPHQQEEGTIMAQAKKWQTLAPLEQSGYVFGDVVMTSINSPKVVHHDLGKMRPTAYLAKVGHRHLVAGLTSLATHKDGSPRVKLAYIPTGSISGRPSYLWGGQLVAATPTSLFGAIDRLGDDDQRLVLAMYGEQLRDVAARHHTYVEHIFADLGLA